MTKHRWICRGRELLPSQRPLVMGIVNVTPDSFSDGGRWFDAGTAIDHARRLISQGADILDIGGESTRPGAEPVSLEEELRRVVPVVQSLARETQVPISIDTYKAEVARQCLDAGAVIVNDVSAGLADPEMPSVVARYQAGYVAMHMLGNPQTMQDNPTYTDVVDDIGNYFQERLTALESAGVSSEQVVLDPGIGFGKTHEQTLTQLARLGEYARFARPICLGVSRKGFLGIITGKPRNERVAASVAVACYAVAAGDAEILRVHDVAETVDAMRVWQAIQSAK